MSKKTVCEIPSRWSLEDYSRHTCTDRSHRHVTRAEASANIRHGIAEWVRPPRFKGPKAIIRIIRMIPARGLSSRVGAPLRIALADREGWALAMLRSIQMRREEPSILPASSFPQNHNAA